MTGLETEAIGLVKSVFGFISGRSHKEPPAIWLDYISSSQPWHQDQVVLRCDGTAMAVDVRVGNFVSNDITWHRRIGIQSLAPGESKTIEAQFSYALRLGHEIGYMHRVLRGGRRVGLPVTFCDLRGNEYTRVFILRQEANATSAVSVRLGKLTKRNRTIEGLRSWFSGRLEV
jgi:hypothetical protein